MYWLKLLVVSMWLLGQAQDLVPEKSSSAQTEPSGEFKLSNGDILKGEVASANEDGLVVKLSIGGFSDRVPWAKFTQTTLKQLATDAKVKPFVEPFIEIPPELKAKRRPPRKEFHAQPPPQHVELADGQRGLMAMIGVPISLLMLAALFLANLYAAYEIALFRNRPVPLVCGVSALLPLLGPILFLSLPAQAELAPALEEVEEASDQIVTRSDIGHAALNPMNVASSLTMAKGDKGATTATLQPATYARGEFTFNRRFFETKFPGFFRIVPGEAEKDMILVIKTVRSEHIARRIARITSKEVHVQLVKGGAEEVPIGFGEITQVQLRHKDAKA